MVSLNVNGMGYQADVDPRTPLLWVLRDAIGLRVSLQPRLRVFLRIGAKVKAGELNLSGGFGGGGRARRSSHD
jgi:hypothetical protein